MAEKTFSVRRIITGVTKDGKSFIESDAPSPHVNYITASGSLAMADLWSTTAAPSPADATDILKQPPTLAPPRGGSVFRFLRIPPDKEMFAELEKQKAGVDQNDPTAAEAFAHGDKSRHPFMHKTHTIDYAIVISGEVWAIMDKDETLMRAGDVLVQRATNHAWANRSNAPCVIAFVLVDAKDGISASDGH